jgi:hypothetical protein
MPQPLDFDLIRTGLAAGTVELREAARERPSPAAQRSFSHVSRRACYPLFPVAYALKPQCAGTVAYLALHCNSSVLPVSVFSQFTCTSLPLCTRLTFRPS